MIANRCRAVIFDMDGILIDSEAMWDRARIAVVAEFGGTYRAGVAADVMGMNTAEWSRYLRERVGIPLADERIAAEVVGRLVAQYERDPPFFPGALAAVRRARTHWPTAIASSSSRDLIDLVVRLGGLGDTLGATVSASEAGRGKPAPDVYLEAASRLGADPALCVAIEDSGNGIRAAKNAGLRVIAVPHPDFPPAAADLALADARLAHIADLAPEIIAALLPALPADTQATNSLG